MNKCQRCETESRVNIDNIWLCMRCFWNYLEKEPHYEKDSQYWEEKDDVVYRAAQKMDEEGKYL